MTITMDVRPEKRRELLQTFSDLLPFLKQESGYCDSQVYIDRKSSNHLILVERWKTQQDVERYMRSNYFTILRGAMQLLTTSSDITFAQVPPTASIQALFTGQRPERTNMNECQAPICS